MIKANTALETIEGMDFDQVTVVASVSDGSSGAQVREAAGLRWLVNGGSSVQSLMSVDSPTSLQLPNHIAMLYSLLMVDDVETILSLGMGGGSLERFLHKHYPSSAISSVEPNKNIIKFAHELFGVPQAVDILACSAEEFVHTTQQRFNVIFCDIFDQERHPACLSDQAFYQDVKSILQPEGVLAMNTTPESDAALLDILQALRRCFSVVYLATIKRRGNVVVIAKNGGTESADVLRTRAETLSSRADVPLTQWVDEYRLIPAP